MHYIIIGANDHTLCGVGIVVPGIERKAGADISAGATMPVLYLWRVQNAGIIITVGVKVFDYACYNTCIKVVTQS